MMLSDKVHLVEFLTLFLFYRPLYSVPGNFSGSILVLGIKV